MWDGRIYFKHEVLLMTYSLTFALTTVVARAYSEYTTNIHSFLHKNIHKHLLDIHGKLDDSFDVYIQGS